MSSRESSCGSPLAAARSRRPCGSTRALRPGLAFMTIHFRDDIDVNVLTIDATDPKSGTAEFKATAVRVEKLNGGTARRPAVGERRGRRLAWTSICSTPSRRRPSATPSTRSSARRCRAGSAPIGSRTVTRRTAGMPRERERHQLLPTLHALHEHAGWISPGALNYIAPPTDDSPRGRLRRRDASMRCSRSSRARRACCTSATTWCAAAPARTR